MVIIPPNTELQHWLKEIRATGSCFGEAAAIEKIFATLLDSSQWDSQKNFHATVLKDIKNRVPFIGFIEKSFTQAVNYGLLPKDKVAERKIQLYAILASKRLTTQELQNISDPLFQRTYLSQHLESFENEFSQINSSESKREEKQIILQWAASLGKCDWVVRNLTYMNLSHDDVVGILTILNETSPEAFKEHLLRHNSLFRKLSEHQKIKIIKENQALIPENLKSLIKHLNIKEPNSFIDIVFYFSGFYSEETLYKIENFNLFLNEKLNLFLRILALNPGLMASWKAAFLLKNRVELAKDNALIEALLFFDALTLAEVEDSAFIDRIQARCETLHLVFPLKQHLDQMVFSFKKEFILKLAYTIDMVAMSYTDLDQCTLAVEFLLKTKHLNFSHVCPLIYFILMPANLVAVKNSSSLPLSERLAELVGIKAAFAQPIENNQALYSLILILVNLKMHPGFSEPLKHTYAEQLLASNNYLEMLDKAHALASLISINDKNILKTHSEPVDVTKRFCILMESWLQMKLPSDFINSYRTTFGAFRLPQVLAVYANELQKLDETEKKEVTGALRTLVLESFSKTLEKNRYSITQSEHLKQIFSRYPSLEEKWKINGVYGPVCKFIDQPLRTCLSDCYIQETDDLEDLFLCTTEIGGSCLSLYGQCNDNKSFLAYLLDGKNKLFIIKNAIGYRLGRVLIRILIDTDHKPVLLLDTFYCTLPYYESGPGKSLSAYEQLQAIVLEAAKQKARMLQLPLLKAFSTSEPYPLYSKTVYSLGSRAPFECCNALGALDLDETSSKGQFELTKTLLIQDAQQQ